MHPTQAALRATHTNTPARTGRTQPQQPRQRQQPQQQTPYVTTTRLVCLIVCCLFFVEHCILLYVYGDSATKVFICEQIDFVKETMYAYCKSAYSAVPYSVRAGMYVTSWLLCFLSFKML